MIARNTGYCKLISIYTFLLLLLITGVNNFNGQKVLKSNAGFHEGIYDSLNDSMTASLKSPIRTAFSVTGSTECLELTLTLMNNNNSFTVDQGVNTELVLRNISNETVHVEYFPNMPFNILLYDTQGELIKTFRGPRGASMVRSDIMELSPLEVFSKEFNFSLGQIPPGEYDIAAVFIGAISANSMADSSLHCKLNGKTITTDRLGINVD